MVLPYALHEPVEYREQANKERVEALKKSGMRIDEPVRELKWNK